MGRLAVEGTRPGEHLVEHDAERKHVGARVDAVSLAPDLLGAGVVRRAREAIRLGQAVTVDVAGQAEVDEADAAVFADQDVVRFDVPVDHAVVVRVVQRVADACDDLDDLGRPILAGDDVQLEPWVVDHRRQVRSFDELHREEVCAVGLADVVDRHDGVVAELRGRRSLPAEPLDVDRRERDVRRQHLEGHAAAERHVHGFVDDSHAAAADLAQHAVLADVSFGRRCLVVGRGIGLTLAVRHHRLEEVPERFVLAEEPGRIRRILAAVVGEERRDRVGEQGKLPGIFRWRGHERWSVASRGAPRPNGGRGPSPATASPAGAEVRFSGISSQPSRGAGATRV